jgi:hypothetical protein
VDFKPEHFVAVAGWQFAHTMPAIPHEYTVRGKRTAGIEPPAVELHDAFAIHVREHGYPGAFDGRTYIYLDLDGWKYWVIGEVINRERLDDNRGTSTDPGAGSDLQRNQDPSARVAAITDIGTIEIARSQREVWKTGRLSAEWAERYPDLFDELDLQLVKSQGHLGHHFIEWLGAILIYHTTGYLSLVQKYEFAKHRRKQLIAAKMLPPNVLAILPDRIEHGRAQAPDLLAYSPDFSDWFFCEVKGPGDRLRPEQQRKFEALASASEKPVRLLHFRWASA